MRLCIYGTRDDEQSLVSSLDSLNEMAFRQIEIEQHDDYDKLICSVNSKNYDAVIIMKNNAEGMEGVIAVKTINQDIPVIWFSNDKSFGAQSYRLNAAYFHEKPVSPQVVIQALASCQLI